MRRIFLAIAILILVPLLAACASGGGDDPAPVVENYLQALVSKDADTLSNLSCAAWEESAILELDAFQAVEARLEGVECAEQSREGDSATVACQGEIVATYNQEDQSFPLADRPYVVLKEDGEWRVCGYLQ